MIYTYYFYYCSNRIGCVLSFILYDDDDMMILCLIYNDILLAIRVSHNETINISESCTRMKERKNEISGCC